MPFIEVVYVYRMAKASEPVHRLYLDDLLSDAILGFLHNLWVTNGNRCRE